MAVCRAREVALAWYTYGTRVATQRTTRIFVCCESTRRAGRMNFEALRVARLLLFCVAGAKLRDREGVSCQQLCGCLTFCTRTSVPCAPSSLRPSSWRRLPRHRRSFWPATALAPRTTLLHHVSALPSISLRRGPPHAPSPAVYLRASVCARRWLGCLHRLPTGTRCGTGRRWGHSLVSYPDIPEDTTAAHVGTDALDPHSKPAAGRALALWLICVAIVVRTRANKSLTDQCAVPACPRSRDHSRPMALHVPNPRVY